MPKRLLEVETDQAGTIVLPVDCGDVWRSLIAEMRSECDGFAPGLWWIQASVLSQSRLLGSMGTTSDVEHVLGSRPRAETGKTEPKLGRYSSSGTQRK